MIKDLILDDIYTHQYKINSKTKEISYSYNPNFDIIQNKLLGVISNPKNPIEQKPYIKRPPSHRLKALKLKNDRRSRNYR